MAHFSIVIPNEFLQALDELVMQTAAGTRETWLRNVVANILVEYQLRKDLAQQIQRRTMELSSLWR